MFYHKVYMNQIHSSSLLCQLASMWKNQVLCDAVIKTGNVVTKAHRVVLVASCPMLHSMKNASTGSNLEVRLASDISQEAVGTFLQYLYEGFMMLTEGNCKDVEKIARVLQVDNVLKCCSDFYKCLHAGNGYEYNFHDSVEFRHVRSSDMLKVHESSKRVGDYHRPSSPATKRMRTFRSGSSDQNWQAEHSSSSYTTDPWDRVPRDGLQSSMPTNRTSHPGVIDMVEDSVEIVHTERLADSGGGRDIQRSISLPQDRVAISVASQINPSADVQIIDTSFPSSSSSVAQQDSISVIGSHSSPSLHASSSHRQHRSDMNQRFPTPNVSSHKSHSTSQSPPRVRPQMMPTLQKPFAAGSASQSNVAGISTSVAMSSPSSTRESPVAPSPVSLWRSQSAEILPPDKSPGGNRPESKATSDTDVMSDISIVKIESCDPGDPDHADDPNLTLEPQDQSIDMTGEDFSNEASNMSGDKNMPQWFADSVKDMPVSYGKMSPWNQPVGYQQQQHILVSTENSKLRPCALCTFYRIKTKSGWKVYTRRKCNVCDVPLCYGQRNCFKVYHSHFADVMKAQDRQSDATVSEIVSQIMMGSSYEHTGNQMKTKYEQGNAWEYERNRVYGQTGRACERPLSHKQAAGGLVQNNQDVTESQLPNEGNYREVLGEGNRKSAKNFRPEMM